MTDLSRAMFDAITVASGDAVIGQDTDGRITGWNLGAQRLFGYGAADIIGQPIDRLVAPDRLEEDRAHMARVARGGAVAPVETRGWTRDGHAIHVLVSIAPVLGAAGEVIGAVRIVRDIRARLARQQEIDRLPRLYSSLTSINQAILRAGSREDLFRQVCTIIVESGGLRTAQILMHDPQTKQIVPVARASAGTAPEREADGYLDIYSDHRPGGLGPGGRAFRSGQPVICNDISNDPTTRHLWEWARQFDLWSLADFPIFQGGVPVGLLIVNSDEKDYFQELEITLLSRAASDISFALEKMAEEEARHAAEAQVRSEQAFGDAMINAMPGVVYFYDTEGRFVRWNRNFETVTGYSHDEIAAMHPLDFFTGADKQKVRDRIADVFATGEATVEADFLTRAGTRIPHHFTGRRVEMGGRTYLIGVGVDISARRQAEAASRESQLRYRALFQHAPDGILIGTNDRFVDANDSMCKMLGLPHDQIVGQRASDFVADADLSRLASGFARFKSGATYREQLQLRRSDGSMFPADVIVARLPDGHVVAMARDVSEREAAATALRDLNRTLETRVQERTSDLVEALLTATNADRIKSAFLANMSHELRTPLNSIIGFTGIILQGLAGPLNDEQQKQLGMVRSSARHLLDLINDVLDISKIEAGQVSVRHAPFDLAECVGHAVESIRPAAQKKGLDLVVDMQAVPRTMAADPRRIEQILINLLSNAVKFTEKGGVTVTVSMVEDFRPSKGGEAQPAVRFAVADTGIGIDPEDLGTLFQPFRQLEVGLSRNHEGTGLGLAICRRLARLMEGDVSATSVPGEGSTFTATIPLGKVGAP